MRGRLESWEQDCEDRVSTHQSLTELVSRQMSRVNYRYESCTSSVLTAKAAIFFLYDTYIIVEVKGLIVLLLFLSYIYPRGAQLPTQYPNPSHQQIGPP
jgi:hypothetical protein